MSAYSASPAPSRPPATSDSVPSPPATTSRSTPARTPSRARRSASRGPRVISISTGPSTERTRAPSDGQRRPVAPPRLRGFTTTRVRCATNREYRDTSARNARFFPHPRARKRRFLEAHRRIRVYAQLLELTALLSFWLCLGAWQEEGAASGRRTFVGLSLGVFAWTVGVLAHVEGIVCLRQSQRIAMLGAIPIPALWLSLGLLAANHPLMRWRRYLPSLLTAPQLVVYA